MQGKKGAYFGRPKVQRMYSRSRQHNATGRPPKREPIGGKAPRPARLVHVVPNDGVAMGRSLKTQELVLPGSMGRNTYKGETRDLKSPAYDPPPSSSWWVKSHRNASSRPYRSPLVPGGRKDGQVTGWLSSTQSRQNVGCLMGFPNG